MLINCSLIYVLTKSVWKQKGLPALLSKVVLLLILLVNWLDIPKNEEFQVLEFFAGVGRIAALSKHCGYKSGAVDITYGEEQFKAAGKRSPLDLNSDAGLVSLI